MPRTRLPLIRVHIVSSRTLVRSGLGALLRGQPQVQVVGESADLANTAGADLVLWDVCDANPHSFSIPFLALLSDPSRARTWLDAGAAGIVMETSLIEQLLDAIRQAARGETYLPRELAQQVVRSTRAGAPPESPVEPLSERERQVLELLAQGQSNKDIAQNLYLSVRTVEGHLANIYGKLGVKSRTEAAVWAIQNRQDERRRTADETEH